jgi:FkbM family methyltransferase
MSLSRHPDGSLNLLGRLGRTLGLGRLMYHVYYRPRIERSRRRVPDSEVEVRQFGMRFHMPSPRKFDCFREIYLRGVWEPEVTQAVRELVRPGMNVALVGADVGYYVLLAASLDPGGTIFAIEPFPEHFQILERNVRDNDLSGVRLFNIAAGAADGTARLVNPGTESRLDQSESAAGVEVRVRRLDDVLGPELTAGQKLDLVQIDVEGAELEVLKGLESIVSRDRPTLLIELHGPYLPKFGTSKPQVLRWLTDHGYDSRWLAMDALDDAGFSHVLCIPRVSS